MSIIIEYSKYKIGVEDKSDRIEIKYKCNMG